MQTSQWWTIFVKRCIQFPSIFGGLISIVSKYSVAAPWIGMELYTPPKIKEPQRSRNRTWKWWFGRWCSFCRGPVCSASILIFWHLSLHEFTSDLSKCLCCQGAWNSGWTEALSSKRCRFFFCFGTVLFYGTNLCRVFFMSCCIFCFLPKSIHLAVVHYVMFCFFV